MSCSMPPAVNPRHNNMPRTNLFSILALAKRIRTFFTKRTMHPIMNSAATHGLEGKKKVLNATTARNPAVPRRSCGLSLHSAKNHALIAARCIQTALSTANRKINAKIVNATASAPSNPYSRKALTKRPLKKIFRPSIF